MTRPPTQQPPPPRAPATPQRRTLAVGKPTNANGHRVILFGCGGVGKTTLACTAPGPVAFIDLDDSLGRLRQKLATLSIPEPAVVQRVASWSELRETVNADGWDAFKTLVIDSASVAEDFAVSHVLATVKTDRGERATGIEDYGFGKGYQHVFDAWLPLLSDLDAHSRAGRHVVMICHDTNASVPNPAGADWIRAEPRMQTTASGKASIRLRTKEWADHVLYLAYDVDVREGKGFKAAKAVGSGTVTVHARELPSHLAKSRTLVDSIPMEDALTELWARMIGAQEA